ncbi:MAG: F0F1 ATP synthase subunit B [bacterium]
MEINFSQVLFQVLNFGVIFWVLTKYLYKPVLKLLADRKDKINAGLAAAEKNLKAEKDSENEKKAVLAKARKEAAEIIKDATLESKKQGEAIVKEAKEKASQEAERILTKAENAASQKQKEASLLLKDLVIATTSKVLGETLSKKELDSINKAIANKLK